MIRYSWIWITVVLACQSKEGRQVPSAQHSSVVTQERTAVALDAGDENQTSSDGGIKFLASSSSLEPHAPRRIELSSTEQHEFAKAHATFAVEYLQRFAQNGARTNLVFSPLSLQLGYALALAAATGPTREKLAGRIARGITPDKVERALQNWSAQLLPSPTEGSTAVVVLRLSNAIWLDSSLPLHPIFIERVREHYGAAIVRGALLQNPSEVVSDINGWIGERTSGRIPKLLDALGSSPAVLVNATYLKTSFSQAFSAPAPAKFHLDGGQDRSAEFVKRTGSYRIAVGSNYEAVEVPLGDTSKSLLAIQPRLGTLQSFLATLSSDKWVSIAQALHDPGKPVELHWPKFDVRSRFPNLDDLSQASLDLLDGTRISAAVHEATIKADEYGLEAAAATAISTMAVARRLSGTVRPIILRIDHPFIFAVVDATTSAVIFMGLIVSPS